jgi:hypothetical protein
MAHVSANGWMYGGPAALTAASAGLFGGGFAALVALILLLRSGGRRWKGLIVPSGQTVDIELTYDISKSAFKWLEGRFEDEREDDCDGEDGDDHGQRDDGADVEPVG